MSWSAAQVNDCRTYYQEQCRGGLPAGSQTPTPDSLSLCTTAIAMAPCDAIGTVAAVAALDGCRDFLAPGDGGTDAPADVLDTAAEPDASDAAP